MTRWLILGLLMGGLIGASAALLLASERGAETRRLVRSRAEPTVSGSGIWRRAWRGGANTHLMTKMSQRRLSGLRMSTVTSSVLSSHAGARHCA